MVLDPVLPYANRTIAAVSAAAMVSVSYLPPLRNAVTGSGEPTCPLLVTFGWQCPVCGMSRGVIATMRGDLGSAVALHPFSLLLVISIAVLLAATFIPGVASRLARVPLRLQRFALGIVLTSLAAYSLLRNLPSG